MASIADLQLALIRASLAAIGDVSPRDGYPELDSWRRLTSHLDASEADRLPAALAATLPVLGANDDRFRILLGVLASFDIYEATHELVQYAASNGNLEAAIAAARLASNPGVPLQLTRRLMELSGSAGWDSSDVAALTTRLDPQTEGPTPRLARLRKQSWPGLANGHDESLLPIVFVDEAGAPPERWQVMGDLVEAGAAVRRIPREAVREPNRAWIPTNLAIMSWRGESALNSLRWLSPTLTADQFVDIGGLARIPTRGEILRRIDAALGGNRLRLPTRQADVELDPIGVDSYRLGSFDLRELVFLSGSRSSTVDRLRDELKPRDLNGVPYWTYNQLFALRTWEIWRKETSRIRFPTDIIQALVAWQGAEKATEVAVTSKGRILVKKGTEFVDWQTGDVVLTDFLALDRVFAPRAMGGGRDAPRLPSPSDHTFVHPALQGGTPCVQHHRIPAKVLARLAVGKHQQIDAVRAVYPQLEESVIVDAVALGGRVLEAA